jgi:hypothetical protein
VTNLADSGLGSLRGQLAAASAGDAIVFKQGLSGTIALGGTLTLDRDISVAGPLDAAGNPLVTLSSSGQDDTMDLWVNPGVTAAVSGLTFTGATDAAIFNRGSLTLRNVAVTGNWIGYWGLISNFTGTVYNAGGTLVVQDSRITANHLRTDSLGNNGGGGIESGYYLGSAGTLTIVNSTVANNEAEGGSGGGIWLIGGTAILTGVTVTGNSAYGNFGAGGIGGYGFLTLTGCTISANSTTANGGGIAVAGSGAASITNCTISGNTGQIGGGIYFGFGNGWTLTSSTVAYNQVAASGKGGGIFVAQRSAVAITNSTVAGNTAGNSATGGGICVANGSFISSGGTLTLLNSTVARNQCDGSGGGLWVGATKTQVRLANTIVAGNTASTGGPDVFGPLLSTSAYNLIGDGTGSSGLTGGSNGNQVGTTARPIDPRLGPLRDNGGPTWTMALLPGSPAIDAGDNTTAPATDQRGLPRVMRGRIDIGAFEVQ